jgi:glycosyltransferase involved in cell wall biosynthesis
MLPIRNKIPKCTQSLLYQFFMSNTVCLATFNGEKYVRDQICSIIDQLDENDELIICDDGSTDSTLDIIAEIDDQRIRLEKNSVPLGVINNFTKALRLANNPIVFLSDQDDVWMPDKVRKVTNIFHAHPDVTLVTSDAQVIDGSGSLLADSFFENRGSFTDNPISNLIKNKHLGCTLAFRREMLDLFLPFPNDTPMHDIWIGLVNGIYGKAYFLEEPLIQYRRHGANVSSTNHTGAVQMMKWRLTLCKNLTKLMLKRGVKKVSL